MEKIKDFRDFEVTEDEEKAEYIQILSYRGDNMVIRIEESIGKTYQIILKYYFHISEWVTSIS